MKTRKIKFKLYYLGKFFGYEWLDKSGWHYQIIEFGDRIHDGTIPAKFFATEEKPIRMELAGLDENKQEIYEGDIVKSFPTYPSINLPGVISSKNKYFNIGFIIDYNSPGYVGWQASDKVRLIGNIIENPELLINDKISEKISDKFK